MVAERVGEVCRADIDNKLRAATVDMDEVLRMWG